MAPSFLPSFLYWKRSAEMSVCLHNDRLGMKSALFLVPVSVVCWCKITQRNLLQRVWIPPGSAWHIIWPLYKNFRAVISPQQTQTSAVSHYRQYWFEFMWLICSGAGPLRMSSSALPDPTKRLTISFLSFSKYIQSVAAPGRVLFKWEMAAAQERGSLITQLLYEQNLMETPLVKLNVKKQELSSVWKIKKVKQRKREESLFIVLVCLILATIVQSQKENNVGE